MTSAAGALPPGLTTAGAELRRRQEGPNELGADRGEAGVLRQLVAALANPLVLLLLVAGALSAVLGQAVNAVLIVAMVVLSVTLNFLQTYRSIRAADRLRREVAPTASARRDGAWVTLPRRELVSGDRIRLVAGDLVPADVRLLDARELHVQQAALTGESLPVEKRTDGSEDERRLYLGTSIVSGTAEAVVTATGPRTRFGDVVARLASRPPETEFERGTRRFGYLIMRTVLFLILFVLLFSILLRRDPMQSLLFAVALAVGLTPEFLPMITSVTLARGAVRMARQKVIVKHLEAIQNFGSIDVLLSDKTGTLTSGEMALVRCCDSRGKSSEGVLELARLNSAWQTGLRSPLDEALLAGGSRPEVAGVRKLDEVPFDFERRRLSVVVERSGVRRLVTKGAPEGILPLCTTEGEGRLLDATGSARAEALYRELSGQGRRVIAVASRIVDPKEAYGPEDERELTLAGFAIFSDPVLPDARDMVETMRRDGVDIKIVTGDSELVAGRVAREVGLGRGRALLGDEIDGLTDSALEAAVERSDVFARVSPAQKNRIVVALKRCGHVVGFLGDGINDAPSLHAADVGISVASAADVAREAADIILLERNLRVLHLGILEGRKSFGNVMKYLLMGTSSNFGNMFSMAAASLFLPFLPMLPTQILLNNFLYDLAQVTIPSDRVDPDFVRRPRRWDVGLIRRFMLGIGPISSIFDFVTFGALLVLFRASEAVFQTGWFVESLATQTLVLFVIRTAGNPLRSRPSLLLTLTTVGVVLVALFLPFTPAAAPLGLVPLPGRFFLFLAGIVAAYLACVEAVKRRLLRGPGGGPGGIDSIASRSEPPRLVSLAS